MNTLLSPSTVGSGRFSIGENKKRGITSLLFSLLLACMVGSLSAHAAIIDNFNDRALGTGDWQGSAGNGWAGGWTAWKVADKPADGYYGTQTVAIDNASPLVTGGDKYLQMTYEATGTKLQSARVWREYTNYGGVSLTSPQTISFEFRLDTDAASMGGIYLYASNNIYDGNSPTSSQASWLIQVSDSGSISFYSGTTRVGTGITLATGDVYRFTIDVDPANLQYVGMVENLSNPVSFQTGNLDYRSSWYYDNNVYSSGKYLNFLIQRPASATDTTLTNTFSIDNISIIPEPRVVLLVVFAAAAILFGRCRRTV